MTAFEAPRRPVTKTIGGVTFEDPYDWLREDGDEALRWQEGQVDEAVGAVRSSPAYEPVLTSLLSRPSGAAATLETRIAVAGRWFWIGRNDAGTAQAVRVAEERDGAGRMVVDADTVTAARGDGRPTTFLYAIPSPDGRLVAFSHSAGGEPFGHYGVVEVESGRLLDTAAETMQGNMLRADWLPDATGFYWPGRAADGRHQLRFAAVTEDAVPRPDVVFDPAAVSATALGVTPQVSPGGKHVLAVTVPHEYVAAAIVDVATGEWRRFAPDGFAAELYGVWLDDDTYLAIVTDTPRGRVVAIPVATSTDRSTWREIVPAGERVLRSLDLVAGRLVLSALRDVSLDISVHEVDGTPVGHAPLPPASASFGLVLDRVRPRSEEFTFPSNTFTAADTVYRLDTDTVDLTIVAEGERLDGMVVEQYFATSADGTRVPYFVAGRSDLDRASPRPTLVNAYGGFNIPWLPVFLGESLPFLEAGGLYVRASLRGGSEYGREWYDAGAPARQAERLRRPARRRRGPDLPWARDSADARVPRRLQRRPARGSRGGPAA